MKLEVGKKYKTLSGIVCICINQGLLGYGGCEFTFKVIGSNMSFITNSDGKASDSAGSQFNIVAEDNMPVNAFDVEFYVSNISTDNIELDLKYHIDKFIFHKHVSDARKITPAYKNIYRLRGFLAFEFDSKGGLK